jgi:hypothetical protein
MIESARTRLCQATRWAVPHRGCSVDGTSYVRPISEAIERQKTDSHNEARGLPPDATTTRTAKWLGNADLTSADAVERVARTWSPSGTSVTGHALKRTGF